MREIVLHVETEEIIDFDSIHFLKIKLKAPESEEQNIWKSFESSTKPHILFRITSLTEYFIISFHTFSC